MFVATNNTYTTTVKSCLFLKIKKDHIRIAAAKKFVILFAIRKNLKKKKSYQLIDFLTFSVTFILQIKQEFMLYKGGITFAQIFDIACHTAVLNHCSFKVALNHYSFKASIALFISHHTITLRN